MPIYEYQCTACKHAFDVLQKLSDDPLTDCPECAQPKLRKLISAPNFRLKGGGWYETDFKDKNKRNLAGDDGKASTPAAGDSDKASAASDKPAAKAAGDKPAAKPVEPKPSKPKSTGSSD